MFTGVVGRIFSQRVVRRLGFCNERRQPHPEQACSMRGNCSGRAANAVPANSKALICKPAPQRSQVLRTRGTTINQHRVAGKLLEDISPSRSTMPQLADASSTVRCRCSAAWTESVKKTRSSNCTNAWRNGEAASRHGLSIATLMGGAASTGMSVVGINCLCLWRWLEPATAAQQARASEVGRKSTGPPLRGAFRRLPSRPDGCVHCMRMMLG